MLEIKIKDSRSEEARLLGFLKAEDKERDLYLYCKIYIYSDNSMSLEKFMEGKVEDYKFQCSDWKRDTLFFKGRGRGRKPEKAEVAMYDFIREVDKEISNKLITDYQ